MELKLGKLEAKRDERNIKFRAFLPKKLEAPPPEYDVDMNNEGVFPIPVPMFANDQWGCCVIAGRAHFTLRLEKLEQGVVIPITDDDVLREYWREQGDPSGKRRLDNGLYVLDSLKSWRAEGWKAAGRQYNIYAFAQIDQNKILEVMHGIHLLNGLMVGATLPQSALDQLNNKEIWYTTDNDGGIVGGHLMYVVGYTRTGPKFITWGQRQVATWEWFVRYVDEVYGIVDDKDKFLGKNSPLEIDILNSILKEITA